MSDLENYRRARAEAEQQELLQMKELKDCANRLFSSPDGKKYGKQMLIAARIFKPDTSDVSDNRLRYLSGQKDFVNIFLTNLVDQDVLLGILESK